MSVYNFFFISKWITFKYIHENNKWEHIITLLKRNVPGIIELKYCKSKRKLKAMYIIDILKNLLDSVYAQKSQWLR